MFICYQSTLYSVLKEVFAEIKCLLFFHWQGRLFTFVCRLLEGCAISVRIFVWRRTVCLLSKAMLNILQFVLCDQDFPQTYRHKNKISFKSGSSINIMLHKFELLFYRGTRRLFSVKYFFGEANIA